MTSVTVQVTLTRIPDGRSDGLARDVHDILRAALPDAVGLSVQRLGASGA